jgi:hypothetical protein
MSRTLITFYTHTHTHTHTHREREREEENIHNMGKQETTLYKTIDKSEEITMFN